MSSQAKAIAKVDYQSNNATDVDDPDQGLNCRLYFIFTSCISRYALFFVDMHINVSGR